MSLVAKLEQVETPDLNHDVAMLHEDHEEQQIAMPMDRTVFDKIEELQKKGVNVADIKKLKEGGYATVQAIRGCMRKELCAIKGMSDVKVDQILKLAGEQENDMCPSGFVTCRHVANIHENRCKISTGASALDNIIGGGVETCTITELYGEFKSGKTQICHSIAVIAQMDVEEGGAGGRVLYIDTEGTFRPDRIAQIAASRGFDGDSVIDNILVARCLTSEHLLKLINDAGLLMCDDEQPYACVIVDSIMGVFRYDYCGRAELAERQQALGKVMHKLQKLSEEFNVAVVITNQVMADPSGGGSSFAAAMPKPVGGHILAHASTCRLFCRPAGPVKRKIKLIDHPSCPEAEAEIDIYEGGVRNSD